MPRTVQASRDAPVVLDVGPDNVEECAGRLYGLVERATMSHTSRSVVYRSLYDLLDQLTASGMLAEVMAHEAAQAGEMLSLALCAHDVDLLLALLKAGAPPDALQGDDAFAALFQPDPDFPHPVDASGAAVTGDRLLDYAKQLYAAGLRVPEMEHVSDTGELAARSGNVGLLQFVVETLDPMARPDGTCESGSTLLHVAARYAQVEACRFLLQRGWTLTARDSDRAGRSMNALGCCLCAREPSIERTCDVLDVLLADVADGAEELLLQSGVVEGSYASNHAAAQACTMSTPAHARALIRMCAAVRARPAMPRVLLHRGVSAFLHFSTGILCGDMHMDECVLVGDARIYLPDPLRADADAAAAVRFAVSFDAVLATLAHTHQQDARSVLQVWTETQAGAPRWKPSSTVRSWAWMRRMHALRWRRVAL